MDVKAIIFSLNFFAQKAQAALRGSDGDDGKPHAPSTEAGQFIVEFGLLLVIAAIVIVVVLALLTILFPGIDQQITNLENLLQGTPWPTAVPTPVGTPIP